MSLECGHLSSYPEVLALGLQKRLYWEAELIQLQCVKRKPRPYQTRAGLTATFQRENVDPGEGMAETRDL